MYFAKYKISVSFQNELFLNTDFNHIKPFDILCLLSLTFQIAVFSHTLFTLLLRFSV